jgi:glutamate synthase (NADPH/NADH) small chain
VGPEADTFCSQLGMRRDERGNLVRDDDYASDVPGVFVAGDAGRGQSLIVWAIAEGRAAASSIDEFLMGTTNLPKPLPASARQVTV